jgi:hypothetical protein
MFKSVIDLNIRCYKVTVNLHHHWEEECMAVGRVKSRSNFWKRCLINWRSKIITWILILILIVIVILIYIVIEDNN